jgi:hypothetical protein
MELRRHARSFVPSIQLQLRACGYPRWTVEAMGRVMVGLVLVGIGTWETVAKSCHYLVAWPVAPTAVVPPTPAPVPPVLATPVPVPVVAAVPPPAPVTAYLIVTQLFPVGPTVFATLVASMSSGTCKTGGPCWPCWRCVSGGKPTGLQLYM